MTSQRGKRKVMVPRNYLCVDCNTKKNRLTRAAFHVTPHDICKSCHEQRKYIALLRIERLCLEAIKGDDKVLGEIYQLTHWALAECNNPHKDWGAKHDPKN